MPRSNRPEPQSFDVDQCIALHNQIVATAIAQNPDVPTIKGYFNFHLRNNPDTNMTDENSGMLANQFQEMRSDWNDEDFCRFLDEVDIPSDGKVFFTPEIQGFASPGEMWGIYPSPVPDSMYVHLYRANNGGNGLGVLFDLQTYAATFVTSIFDDVRRIDDPLPDPEWIDARVWLNLEEILEEWLARINSGKYIPHHRDSPAQLVKGCESTSWWMAPYRLADLDDTLQAWDRYLDAIALRMPASDYVSAEKRQLDLTPLLDEYNVTGFWRRFLLGLRLPPAALTFIAPGLYFPTMEFLTISLARAHTRQRHEGPVVPTTLFPLTSSTSTLDPETVEGLIIGVDDLAWEDTVALQLPADTARMPDSALAMQPMASRRMPLFQPGMCPVGFDHAVRFEVLLLQWINLVEKGIWIVGADGVEGGREWLIERNHRVRAEREGLVLEFPCGM